jgi:hypothetical protein
VVRRAAPRSAGTDLRTVGDTCTEYPWAWLANWVTDIRPMIRSSVVAFYWLVLRLGFGTKGNEVLQQHNVSPRRKKDGRAS